MGVLVCFGLKISKKCLRNEYAPSPKKPFKYFLFIMNIRYWLIGCNRYIFAHTNLHVNSPHTKGETPTEVVSRKINKKCISYFFDRKQVKRTGEVTLPPWRLPCPSMWHQFKSGCRRKSYTYFVENGLTILSFFRLDLCGQGWLSHPPGDPVQEDSRYLFK